MNRVYIRACPRDDFIARLCYETWRLVGVEAEYGFLLEQGTYHFLPEGVAQYTRPSVGNFSGSHGPGGLVAALGLLPEAKPDDRIVVCDADVILWHDPLKDLLPGVAHAGVGNAKAVFGHVSGQVQIFSGSFFTFLRNLPRETIDHLVQEMLNARIDILDDTFASFVSFKHGFKKQIFSSVPFNDTVWFHQKLYLLEGLFPQWKAPCT